MNFAVKSLTLGRSKFARNLLATLIRAVGQFVIFSVLAKTVPSNEYGKYFVALSIVSILNSILDMGSYNLVFYLSQKMDNPPKAVQSVITHLVVVSIPSTIISVIISFILPGLDASLIACVAISDIAYRMFMAVVAYSVAVEQYGKMLLVEFSLLVIKCVGLLLFIKLKTDLTQWLIILSVCNVIMATIFYRILGLQKNKIHLPIGIPKDYWRSSLAFAAANLMVIATNELEKPIASRFVGFSDVAVYSVGQRVYSIGNISIGAWMTTKYSSYFSKDSISEKVSTVKRSLLPALLIAAAQTAFFAVLVEAGYIGKLFGEEYNASGIIILIMSSAFFMQAAYLPVADFLSGIGMQTKRIVIQFFTAVIYISTIPLWIRECGLVGLAYNTVLLHFMNLILYYSLFFCVLRGNSYEN